MKKLKILFFLLISIAVFSCGSIPRTMGPYKEAESRKGTQSNKQQTQSQAQQSQPQTKPQAQQPQQNNYEAREETFSMISLADAPKLKAYSIIVGSFSVEENAKKLKKSLQLDHDPIIVINDKGMFRVIIVSFDNYNAAKEEMMKSIKEKFPDAWILTQKR